LLVDYFMPKHERHNMYSGKGLYGNNPNQKMPLMNMNPMYGQNMPQGMHPQMMNPMNMNMMNPMGSNYNMNMKYGQNPNLMNPQMMNPNMRQNKPRYEKPQQQNQNVNRGQNKPNVKQPTTQQTPQQDKDDIDYGYLENLEDDSSKKDYLGEFIFKKIENHKLSQQHNFTIDTIGKITGMILGIEDINEIIDICRNPDNLTGRISEAMELLGAVKN